MGAAIGIAVAAFLTRMTLGTAHAHADLPWLVAPLGASAVLVFAVPASPLAQPWAVIGGNLISATIGITTGLWLGLHLGLPVLAASLAVGAAIAVMITCRCLHPPGGACALLCALGAGMQGWSFTHLLPILANVLALALIGWIFNTLTGHPWPHRHAPVSPTPPTPSAHHTRQDIEDVLADWNEVLDVDVDDLDAFYQALERHVASRKAGGDR